MYHVHERNRRRFRPCLDSLPSRIAPSVFAPLPTAPPMTPSVPIVVVNPGPGPIGPGTGDPMAPTPPSCY